MAHFKQKRLYLCFATAEFCDQNPSNISSFLKSFNADVCWEKEIEKKVSHKKVQVQRKLQKRSHDRRNLLTQLPISWWTIALTHSLYLYIYLPLSYLPTSLANIPTCISITLYLYTSLSVPIYLPLHQCSHFCTNVLISVPINLPLYQPLYQCTYLYVQRYSLVSIHNDQKKVFLSKLISQLSFLSSYLSFIYSHEISFLHFMRSLWGR